MSDWCLHASCSSHRDAFSCPLQVGALLTMQLPTFSFYRNAILQLVQSLDEYIPDPVRDLDKPFTLPVEDVFSIQGRGTVVTGRIETGVVKVGDEVEIVGIQAPQKTTVTGEHCGGQAGSASAMQEGGETHHCRVSAGASPQAVLKALDNVKALKPAVSTQLCLADRKSDLCGSRAALSLLA